MNTKCNFCPQCGEGIIKAASSDVGAAWRGLKDAWTKFKIAKSNKDQKGMEDAVSAIENFGKILEEAGEIDKTDIPKVVQ